MAKARRERRKHKRHELACPVRLAADPGGTPVQSKGVNISDGGILFALAAEAAPPPGARVRLDFSVPRATPNTFLMQEFSCKAIVVRQEPSDGEGPVRVAVAFQPPMDLELEV